MKFTPMNVEYIQDTYFYDSLPDNEEFPTITRSCLLIAPFDDQIENLEPDFLGWDLQPFGPDQILWYSSERRAAFLQIAGEIYLFTFADFSSFEAGIAEIKVSCRRRR